MPYKTGALKGKLTAAEIRKLIKSLGANKTVLLSTHIMQEVEALCDRVLILKKGNLVLNEKLSDLKKQKNKSLEAIFHELTIS